MKRTTLQVDHPQLDYTPGDFNAGRKRYPFHKNLESDRFLLGKHNYNEEMSQRSRMNYGVLDGTYRTSPPSDVSGSAEFEDSHTLREKLRQREQEYSDLLKQLEKRKSSDAQELEFGAKPLRSVTDPFEGLYKPEASPQRVRSQTPLKKNDYVPRAKQPFENLNRSFDRPADKGTYPSKIPAQSFEYSSSPSNSPDPKPVNPKSNIFELAAHPAFSQPRYTKTNPKLHMGDPIVGFRQSPSKLDGSPDRRRGMADYGNMMFNQ